MPKPKIFISYRTEDEKDFVFRIYDRFVDHYGEDHVFIAPDRITDFSDWDERIMVELERCNALVAILGPRWEELLKIKSQQRDEGVTDYVILEIATALERKIVVAPILIKDAALSSKDGLPEEIQGIFDLQFGEPIAGDATFRESVIKKISYIDYELTSRGFAWGNMELEKFLSLPLSDLRDQVLVMLESGKATRLKLLLRDFLPYIQNLLSDSDESPVEAANTALDKLFTVGTTLVQDNQLELHHEFLEVIRDIFDCINDNHSASPIGIQVLLALGIRCYALGALILRETKYGWLSGYLRHSMKREPYHWESQQWFYNLETYLAESKLIDDCGLIKPTFAHIKDSEYFLRLFANDENRALDFLCQLDFSRVLIDRYVDADRKAYASFLWYHNERTMPIVKRLMDEPDFRTTLIGYPVESDFFAQIMRDILMYTCVRPNYIGFWPGSHNSINRSDVERLLQSIKHN
ncbi:MAG: TIR domain-containing protein [Chloroflexi bacterium]|nr:TIR domain-containing protein [Chloroflexota bacterium]